MKSLTAGMLRHTATIEQESTTPDGAGGRVLGWATVGTVRIGNIDLAGREGYLHGRVESPSFGTTYMRYPHGFTVTPAMRLVYNGTAYNIRSVTDVDTRHRWVKLTLESGVTM